MAKAVIGIVRAIAQGEKCVANLKEAGFAKSDISVLLPDAKGTKVFADAHDPKTPDGAVSGGILGGALGLLVGIGAIAIPGLGPFLAAGPIFAALSGAATGVAFGGLTGALVGLGIPELEAKIYEGKIERGNVLVAVHTEDPIMRKVAETILLANGAEHVSAVAEAAIPKGVRA